MKKEQFDRLVEIAYKKTEEICKWRCYKGDMQIERCFNYVLERMINNNFHELRQYDSKRGAKETTYLHTLIYSRVVDFFNSKKEREYSEYSCENSYFENIIEDSSEDDGFLEEFVDRLSALEKTILKYFEDGYNSVEIGSFLNLTSKQILKKRENIRLKLKREMGSGYRKFSIIG